MNYTFDTGSPPAQFTFTRGGPTDDPLTIEYFVGGTAVAGTDYTPLSGAVTIAAGQDSEVVYVIGLTDAPWHYDPRSVSVTVIPVADRYAADTPSSDSILIYSQPYVSIDDVTVYSGDSNARFTVSLSNPVPRDASVDFNTVDFNAAAGVDYVEQHGTLNFLPQETSKYIDIALLDNAGIAAAMLGDFDPHFYVDLTNAMQASPRWDPNRGTCTILTPALSVGNASGDAGDDLQFEVALDRPSPNVVTVDYSTSDGTALDGVDYEGMSGTLVFLPGDTSKTITISTMVYNPDGTSRDFFLTLSNAHNAAPPAAPATGTIQEPMPPDPPGSGSGTGGGGSSETGTGGSSETGSGSSLTGTSGTGGTSAGGAGGTSAGGSGGGGTGGTSAGGTGGTSAGGSGGGGTGGTSAGGTGGTSAGGSGGGGTGGTSAGGTGGTSAGGSGGGGTGGTSAGGTGGTSAGGSGGGSTGGTSAGGAGGTSAGGGTGGISAGGTGGTSAGGSGGGGTGGTSAGGTGAGGTGL